MMFVAALCVALDVCGEPPVDEAVKSHIGDSVTSPGGEVTMVNVGKHQQYDWSDRLTLDKDIHSPKSVNFSPDGSKYYVNSLEGCATVVYDAHSNRKLKVIHHKFPSGSGRLWGDASGYYPFTHYPDGESRAFSGKPVEGVFTREGRYFIVPYYRRTFDRNSQDPSALAVIDTRTNSIVRLMETGPLPKMVAVSHDGHLLTVTHWGDNTVGVVDISSANPAQWRHQQPIVVGRRLQLDYPLDEDVDRDKGSGLAMRGTVFTPDDKYLIIGCLSGPMQIIDMITRQRVGSTDMYNGRHVVLGADNMLYVSTTVSGEVCAVPLDSVLSGIRRVKNGHIPVHGWRRCHPGSNIRTIELSPSGRYLFAAANGSSTLNVIRTSDMKPILSIPCDSYPVGLDVSADGSMVVVTSQGRHVDDERRGGNAVNIYRIAYKTLEVPEPIAKTAPGPVDGSVVAKPSPVATVAHRDARLRGTVTIACGTVLLIALAALAWYISRK